MTASQPRPFLLRTRSKSRQQGNSILCTTDCQLRQCALICRRIPAQFFCTRVHNWFPVTAFIVYHAIFGIGSVDWQWTIFFGTWLRWPCCCVSTQKGHKRNRQDMGLEMHGGCNGCWMPSADLFEKKKTYNLLTGHTVSVSTWTEERNSINSDFQG